mgnify:CR=1 FL=1
MNWRFFDLEHLSASLVIGALVLTLFLTNFGHVNADEATSGPKASPCGEAAWNPKFPEFPDLDLDKDTDEDGLKDWEEICFREIQVGGISRHVFTDHRLSDTDKDGLTDKEELLGRGPEGLSGEFLKSKDMWETNPKDLDTDGDGVSDGVEFEPYTIILDGGYGGRQITVISNPTKADTDDDGLDDKIEREGWSITVNGELSEVLRSSPQDSDTDKDGLTDKEEHDGLIFPSSFWGTVKTDPTRVDTDGDEILDEDEYTGEVKPGKWIQLDPTRVDTDGDGLQDRTELDSVYCDPVRADTDGDGHDDVVLGDPDGYVSGSHVAGNTHVFYGKASGFTADVHLHTLDGTDGFHVDGDEHHDHAGHAVGSADVNGDGNGDLIIGAHDADPNGDSTAGETFVVVGSHPGDSLPYNEDFSDGVADGFAAISGSWSVDGEGRYAAQVSAGSNALSLLTVEGDLPVNLQVSADIVGISGGSGYLANALLVYDYASGDDFKYAGGFFGGNKWRLGHYLTGQWTTDVQVTSDPIDLKTPYSVQLRLTGGEASLWVGGAPKVSHDYGSDVLTDGSNQVGLGTRNALAAFDNLAVNAL